MHKKGHKLKTSTLVKDPQFSSNLADIQAKLPTHEAIILTKFHKECKKNVDFLLRLTFWLVPFFMLHPLVKSVAMLGMYIIPSQSNPIFKVFMY